MTVAVLTATMWLLECIDALSGGGFDRYGVHPRQIRGLTGVLAAPFLHAGFGHLAANTLPFVALGLVIAVSGWRVLVGVLLVVIVVSGLGTWLVAPADSVHLGASGVVFGFITYLISRGFFARRVSYLVVGVVIGSVYGSVLWGVLPTVRGVSWQMHLFGAAGGILAASVLHGDPEPAP